MTEPIIILCEQPFDSINNREASYSSLQGIAYAKYLRRVEKKRNPIIFTSFLSPNQLLEKPKTRILTAIGHGYLQIPYTETQLQAVIKSTAPLNEIQLNDVIINFCQLRSAVRGSFHDFKPKLREIKGSSLSEQQKKVSYETEFANYERILLKDAADYPQVITEFRRLVSEYQNTSRIEMITEVTEEQFSRFLPSEEDENENTVTEAKPWKILFLDDKPSELQGIFQEIDQRKISYDVVKSSAEAKEAIENDKLNYYTVVVSDYRLFEPNSEWNEPRMQPEQGYDFLMWLSKQSRFNSMVALSGLSKWFLMESFRKNQVNIKVYSKNTTLSESGSKPFLDDLEYLGNRQFEAIISIPKTSEWDKQIKHYYKWLRTECGDADSIEEFVSYKANDIIQQLDSRLKLIVNSKVADQFEKYNYLYIEDFIGNTTASLPYELDLDKIDLFKLKLIYRRVLIYYLITGTIKSNIVAKILTLGSANTIPKDNKGNDSLDFEYKEAKKQVFSQQGLAEWDVPFNILVEEKNWLKEKMGIEILNGQIKISMLYELINYYYNLLKEKNPKFHSLPTFEATFKTGKHITALANDMRTLLEELDVKGHKDLLNSFVNKTNKILDELEDLMDPYEKLHVLKKVINQFSKIII